MSNKFGIPKEVEQRIRARDKKCVYHNRVMIKGHPKKMPTIEHFREKGPFYWNKGLKEEDLAICCKSCNSSRREKSILEWFKGLYCIDKNINEKTVAKPVKDFLKRNK